MGEGESGERNAPPTTGDQSPSWWKSQRATRALGVLLGIAALSAVVWWEFLHPFISTDDARVAAICVNVAPIGAGGNVTQLHVDVGCRVVRGQVLAELDNRNANAQLKRAAANATLTRSELERAYKQVSEGCSPQVELDNAVCAAQVADANLQLARVALDNTQLRSTVDGVVVQKLAEIGDMVDPGQTAVTVVAIDGAWVSANIEETYVGRLRVDQPVKISIDEGGTLEGRVGEILHTTAAQFALIPSDNGAGNYTKVVQRVPIKVYLESPLRRTLRVGQSVKIKIRVGH